MGNLRLRKCINFLLRVRVFQFLCLSSLVMPCSYGLIIGEIMNSPAYLVTDRSGKLCNIIPEYNYKHKINFLPESPESTIPVTKKFDKSLVLIKSWALRILYLSTCSPKLICILVHFKLRQFILAKRFLMS